MEFFRAEKISKNFQNHVALNNVSISLPRQSNYGLLGPNGAGKTTFIRIINQITTPDSGEIWFDGQKLSPQHISRIGYLPEERGLYKKMKVGEQAIYLAQLKGLPRNMAIIKLKEWFTKFEIIDWWGKKVEELSKGMAQKIQFIITILHKPDLLIFDEPFSGFDPINVNLIKEEIINLRDNGSTIIFSTHNMESVEELCDHIALINNAEKILEGKVTDIKNTYKTNTFNLSMRNLNKDPQLIIPSQMTLKDTNSIEDITTLKIQIPTNEGPNELIQHFLNHGELCKFEEVLPTMNEIFIRKVKEINPAKQ